MACSIFTKLKISLCLGYKNNRGFLKADISVTEKGKGTDEERMSCALRNGKETNWALCKTTFALDRDGWWEEVIKGDVTAKGSKMLLQSNRSTIPSEINCCLISQAPCVSGLFTG